MQFLEFEDLHFLLISWKRKYLCIQVKVLRKGNINKAPLQSSTAPTGDLPKQNPMLRQNNMGSLVYIAGEASPSSCPISYTDYSAACSVGLPSAS